MGGRGDLAGTIRSDPSLSASTFSNGQSVLTDEQQTQFRTQGYLLVPDALDSIGLERMHAAYEKIRRDTEPAWRRAIADSSGKGVYGHGAAAHVITDLYHYDPLFLDLANNPRIIPILEQVVGPDLQLTEAIGHNHPGAYRVAPRLAAVEPPDANTQGQGLLLSRRNNGGHGCFQRGSG